MINRIVVLVGLILSSTCFMMLQGQEKASREKLRYTDKDLKDRKGDFYFYWGYNRSNYGKSDIKMEGKGYNFTLSEVRAKDMPKELSSVYFDPAQFSVPQFNIRLGFNLNDKYTIAGGWDHMKYQTKNGRSAFISGSIDVSASEKYAGTYNGEKIIMNHDELVKMEHSDGFNVVNINIERNDFAYISKEQELAIGIISGVGLGLAFPWTNSFVFGKRNDDRPHFSGMGSHAYMGIEGTFYKRFFLRYTVQVGFENMWDIAITPKGDNSAHAEQTIYYFERSVVLGYRFRIGNGSFN